MEPQENKKKVNIGSNKSSTQEIVPSKEVETVLKAKIKNESERKRRREGKREYAKCMSSPARNNERKLSDQNPKDRDNEKKLSDQNPKDRNERNQKSGKSTGGISLDVDENREKRNQRNQKSDERIGGMIFMCNAKTKADCFRYLIMGVSTSKQEIVMGIKPGLKLFLYDYDLRLMYGIYEASSIGGMKLEPTAFGGSFPAQVRFRIHEDCLPLPEGVFKKAIKENYDKKTHKFKTQLTIEQVKRLTRLFHPSPRLHSNAKLHGEELDPAPIVQLPGAQMLSREETLKKQVYRERFSGRSQENSMVFDSDDCLHAQTPRPLFLSEKEYRSYGLQPERHILPTNVTGDAQATHLFDNYSRDQEMEQHPVKRTSASINAALSQKEPGCPDLFFPSEKEYQTYGLKGYQEANRRITPPSASSRMYERPIKDACNPYDDSTTSLVNRYLSLPSTVSIPSESYYLTGRETYTNNSGYVRETRDHRGQMNPEGERLYALYASHALSDNNQNYHRLSGEPIFTSEAVSSRYSFAGPSVLRR